MQPLGKAAKLVRGYGEAGDPLARAIFGQQADALGRLFSIAAMFTDPGTYFVGGGVVEADPAFRDWFLAQVRGHTTLRRRAGPGGGIRPGPRSGPGGRAGRRARRPLSHG